MSVPPAYQAVSPFTSATLVPSSDDAPDAQMPPPGRALLAPFSESMTADDESALDREAAEALLAELDDEDFESALEALAAEAAGRHLRAVASWPPQSEVPVPDTTDAEQWMESVAAEADRALGALEAYFADRPADSLREGELEAVSGLGIAASDGFTNPADAQEQFFKSLLGKAKKLAQGAAKLATKGLGAIAKFLPMGRLFGILRQLMPTLLRRVLARAIGKLPPPLRPVAAGLAKRFGAAEASADQEYGPGQSFAEEFDRQVAEFVLAPNEAVVEQLLAEVAAQPAEGHENTGPGALHDLDAARTRLARELATVAPGQPPTAQMEQFVPAVMAAMPLIRLGVRALGRSRVEGFIARGVAQLIQGMVGPQAAGLLSRHIASVGLGLLGLEAENGTATTLGTEALVAAAEDTVRSVLSLPPESLQTELLLETEIQDAFADAAARHLPAAVLRTDLVEAETEGEHAVWLLMPRTTRPSFRYKKYSCVIPVRITRPLARSLVMSGGDTLERRLLDGGIRAWPADGEMEIYELLEGAELGHVAAFEADGQENTAAATMEFEELSESAAALLARSPRLAAIGRRGRPNHHRRGGTRYYRLRVGGRALHRRRLFGLRLDLTSPQPVITVHLRIGEREAHTIAADLEQQKTVQVVSAVRHLLGPAVQQAMGGRLERMLGKHHVAVAPGTGIRLAGQLADAMLRAVAQQLPAASATLARAAKDPASGVLLTFGFTFPDKGSLATAPPGDPTLTIRPGTGHA
ncbi:hypothetical protein [Streptomyces sp. NBC_00658]|uniref:hypothetical protein n=1 Tax=Streptomyces sp. NBC_00658 TaxID=2975800 RepID=UPI0032551B59